MATAALSNDEFDTKVGDNHLEIFFHIWLDTKMNVKDTQNTEQKLRSIINHLKKFQDVKQCQQYIEQRSQKDRLALIVSGEMGQELVPSIHKLRQVISIYVYCMDKKTNEEWACKFAKVKAVVIEVDELISRINKDHKIQKKVEEPLSINIFTTSKSTIGINGQFIFSQILIDCLLRLKSTQKDKNELINCCEKEYEGNQGELSNLHEFELDYSSDKALWWYTRESFFYKTLYAAPRTQNIHMIFLFRAFIADIYHQLQNNQAKTPLRVYRSQLMSSDELNGLKQYIGHFISVNSFFSTSTEHATALFFLGDITSLVDLEPVLFEIDADPKIVTTKSFVDISEYSDFPQESEVLFMLGSIFRLQSIGHNDDQIWIIRMTLCSDDEHDLKQVLMHMKQQIGSAEPNLRTLGTILWNMGKFDLAEKYFSRLLEELPPNDSLLTSLYEDLAKLASQRGNYDMNVQWHQKSLAFERQNTSSINLNISRTNNSIDIIPNININSKWMQDGITVASGHGLKNGLNQLSYPFNVFIDDDQTIYVADTSNHRIMEWKNDATNGQVVAGGNGEGNRNDQLKQPRNVIIDKESDCPIISDRKNSRVVRWPRRNGTSGETIISNVSCSRLIMVDDEYLYVSNFEKHEVRKWKMGDTNGIVVAGGNGQGGHLNQLHYPRNIFIDQDHSVYVSDFYNHRVMKWMKDAKEGIVVAGGQSQGNGSTQLSYPAGIIVDQLGTVYVADFWNHRVMRWLKGATQGSVLVGGNGQGTQTKQFNVSTDLSFDRQNNLDS